MSNFVQMSPIRYNQLAMIRGVLQGIAKRSELRPRGGWSFLAPQFAEDSFKEQRIEAVQPFSSVRNLSETAVDIIGVRAGKFCGQLYLQGFLHLGLSTRMLKDVGDKIVGISGIRFIRPVETKHQELPFEAMFVVPLCDSAQLALSIANGFKRVTKREANLDIIEAYIDQSGLSKGRKKIARSNLALWRLQQAAALLKKAA